MTCKDCIHYEAHRHFDCFFGFNDSEVEMLCPVFKDKSKYIEMPCRVGETLYVIDDEYEGLPQEILKKIEKRHHYKIETYEKITYSCLLQLLRGKDKCSKQGYLMLFETTKEAAEQRLKELKEND